MSLTEKFSGFKNAERPSNGLALVFDVSGFTNFLNKPDIQDYITDYINSIVDCVEISIWGGERFWVQENGKAKEGLPMAIKPVMRKFLGDGMLYVWEDEGQKLSNSVIKVDIMNKMWNLQENIKKINSMIREYMPVADLPKAVKFGIAQGTIYKLIDNDGGVDYIGPCINLASRLVKYCPDINLIVSARLRISKKDIEEDNYIRLIAKELRSFEQEIVLVDKSDYDKLDEEVKLRLFEEMS